MNRREDDERAPRSALDEEGAPVGAARGGEAPQAVEAAGRPGPADVQAYIGRQLRAVYDDVAKQPIPDRFLALMDQLEGAKPGG